MQKVMFPLQNKIIHKTIKDIDLRAEANSGFPFILTYQQKGKGIVLSTFVVYDYVSYPNKHIRRITVIAKGCFGMRIFQDDNNCGFVQYGESGHIYRRYYGGDAEYIGYPLASDTLFHRYDYILFPYAGFYVYRDNRLIIQNNSNHNINLSRSCQNINKSGQYAQIVYYGYGN